MNRALVLRILLPMAFAFTPAPLEAREAPFEEGPELLEIEKLPRDIEESETFPEYIRKRTRFAYGFDAEFNDSIFLDDKKKEDDLISTLEGEILFSDPRGSLLYGFDLEVNAFRFHKHSRNAIDYEGLIFFDLDPGGRTTYRLEHRLKVRNEFVLLPREIDLLRRSTDIQRSVKHTFEGRIKYLLSERDTLTPKIEYSLFDDQFPENDLDQRKALGILDWEHELSPLWRSTVGYEFERVERPGADSAGNLTTHRARLGTKYEVTDFIQLKGNFNLGKSETKDRTSQTDIGFDGGGEYTYPVLPQVTLGLGYSNLRRASYEAGRARFRITTYSAGLTYEVAPLVTLLFGASYEKQRSGGKDILKGTGLASRIRRFYEATFGARWQVRESTHIDFSFRLARAKKAEDYVNHVWILGFESEF